MPEHSPSAGCSDLPTREDVQELREAVESLRDHVQIVWQAIDEVREAIDRSFDGSAPDQWTVEPSQGFGLGRYRPFAGYEPFDEWNAEQEAAAVEPSCVLTTPSAEDHLDEQRPSEVRYDNGLIAANCASESQRTEDIHSLTDQHPPIANHEPLAPVLIGARQQRALFVDAADAAFNEAASTATGVAEAAQAVTSQEEAEAGPPAAASVAMVLPAGPEADCGVAARASEVATKCAEDEISGERVAQYFAPLSGPELTTLMRRHKVTIRQLAKRSGITQKRIREARGRGLLETNVVRDWLQAILGRDPGPIGERPAATPYTLDDWIDFRHRFSYGQVNAAGIHDEFRRMQAGKTQFIEQLVNSKSADELRLMAVQAGCYDASRNSKQRNAEALYRKHLTAFTLGDTVCYSPMQETYENAVERIVMAHTDESIAAGREKSQQERAAREKALLNPETHQEYSQFVARKGTEALRDDQLATWDRFNADISRTARKEKGRATVEQFQSAQIDGMEFRIIEGFHDREEVPLWIVQLTSRVERAAFNELKVKAGQLGGWWSSFKKDAAGFQFRSRESAEKFAGLTEGDADRADELLARKLRKMDSASERLNAVADSLDEKAAEVLAADDGKLKNTARRADMAASMRAAAYRDEADAKTLRSLAAALSDGKSTYLDGVWNAAQVRTLESLLRRSRRERIEARLKEEGIERARHRWSERYDELEAQPLAVTDARYATFPKPYLYAGRLAEAFAQLTGTPGVKQTIAKMQKLVDSRPKDQDFVDFVNDYQVELLEDFLARARAAGCNDWWFDHCLDHYKRLKAASIHDNHELRCALRELVPHLSAVSADDPVQKAEDELRGKDLPGFYPTPRPLIERMLDDAEIEPTHRILEPSCGKGDIVDAIRRRYPEADIVAIEQNLTLQGVLTAKGYGDIVSYGDFLEHQGQYDRIVMNPPFERGQDIEHLRHAYQLLAPGGRVVAIASEGPFFRMDAKSVVFREWLSTLDDEYDAPLPDDTFQGAGAFRQTGVKTRYVILRKP